MFFCLDGIYFMIMLENRRHIRIRELTDVRWTILGSEIAGEGKVYNISESGLQMQTDGHFTPRVTGLMFIDGHDETPLPFGAKKGRIVWLRRMPEGRTGYQCGVEFVQTSWDKPLQDWINHKTEELAQAGNANVLSNYIA